MITLERRVRPAGVRRASIPRLEFLEALRDMKVSQSFVFEMSSYDRSAIHVAGVVLGRRFIARKENDNGLFRIWRIL